MENVKKLTGTPLSCWLPTFLWELASSAHQWRTVVRCHFWPLVILTQSSASNHHKETAALECPPRAEWAPWETVRPHQLHVWVEGRVTLVRMRGERRAARGGCNRIGTPLWWWWCLLLPIILLFRKSQVSWGLGLEVNADVSGESPMMEAKEIAPSILAQWTGLEAFSLRSFLYLG